MKRVRILGSALLSMVLLWPGNAPSQCVGDCENDGTVGISDLVLGVSIALGDQDLEKCASLDADLNQRITIAELVAAVRSALLGCEVVPSPSRTVTAASTPTVSATAMESASPTQTPLLGFSVCGAAGERPGGPNVDRARGVVIRLNPTGRETRVTTASGGFCFPDVAPGAYTLTVEFMERPCNALGCWEEKIVEVIDASLFEVFIELLPFSDEE